MADPVSAVRQIASALNVALSNEEVEQIAEACSIRTVEQILAKQRGVIHRVKGVTARLLALLGSRDHEAKSPATGGDLLQPNHLSSNKGKSGYFKQRLTPEEREAMEARYLRWLNVLRCSPHAECIQSNEIPPA
jgi:hypothetical protein